MASDGPDTDRRRPTGPPVIELDGITKRYATTTAVDDVSLSVADGEFFTLVGPSGCGKTTTLRLVGGFEEPTEGTIRLGGADAAGVPPEDRDVGVVLPQPEGPTSVKNSPSATERETSSTAVVVA